YQWRVTTALQDAFGNSLSGNHTITFTANTLSGGEGTESSPFLISNQVELSRIRERLDKHYRLTNNINLSGIWEPIGDNESQKFTGSLDGNHYQIDNLSSTDNTTIASSTNNFGLFGVLGGNSRIYDLFLKGEVKANSNVGLLAGQAIDNTTVENVYVEGSIEGLGNNTGGLVGLVDNTSTLKKNLAAVNISGIGGTTNAGGLVGLVKAGSVQESTALGSISYGENVGGLVGKLENGNVKNSYARGAVSANDNISGGLVGWNGGTVETSYSTGLVGGLGQKGGLVGENTGTITKSYWNNQTSGQTSSAGEGTDNASGFPSDNMTQQVVAGNSGQLYDGWDNTTIWHLQNQYDYPRLRWQFFAASVGFASGSDNESIQQSDNLSIVFSQAVDNTTLTYSGSAATIRLTQFSASSNELLTAYLSADNQTLTIDPDNSTLGNNYYLALSSEIKALDGQYFIQNLQVPLLVNLSDTDSDNDNLSDYAEAITYGTNPNDNDTDGDGLNDYLEVTGWAFSYRTVDNNTITKTVYSDPTSVDTDGDGLSDSLEYTGWNITY
ncbi:MAG: GLUG motif-containing protein, partial [Deltaproteobacteria bacterium]